MPVNFDFSGLLPGTILSPCALLQWFEPKFGRETY